MDAPEGDENDAEPDRRAKPPRRLGAKLLHSCLMNRRRHRPPGAGAPSLTSHVCSLKSLKSPGNWSGGKFMDSKSGGQEGKQWGHEIDSITMEVAEEGIKIDVEEGTGAIR